MKRILSKMSAASAASFEAYVHANARPYPADTLRYIWKTRGVYLQRLGLPVKKPSTEALVATAIPTAVRYLIPWAADTICKRYTDILENIDR